MPSYAEVLEALPAFRSDLSQRAAPAVYWLDRPGAGTRGPRRGGGFGASPSGGLSIHATGVGLRRTNGRLGDDIALKVFVFDDIRPRVAPASPTRRVATRRQRADPLMPRDYQGIPVDVEYLPVQRIRRQAEPAATPGAPGADTSQRRRHRPIVGGVSISPLHAEYVGTLGCFLRRTQADHDVVLALSNNHVLADIDSLPNGTPIVQPGPETRPTQDLDIFATLSLAVPILFPTASPLPTLNRFDAAVATVLDSTTIGTGRLYGGMHYNPSNVLPSTPGMRVRKIGRTTGATRGVVVDNNVNGTQIDYGTTQPRIAVFNGTIEITGDDELPFSLPGDSGSVVVEEASGHPVALLFAGDGERTTACELGGLCEHLQAWPI